MLCALSCGVKELDKPNKYSEILLERKARVKVEKCSLQVTDIHSDRSREDAQARCAGLSVTNCCLMLQDAAARPAF